MASERFLNDSNIILVKLFPESSNSVEISESNKNEGYHLNVLDFRFLVIVHKVRIGTRTSKITSKNKNVLKNAVSSNF